MFLLCVGEQRMPFCPYTAKPEKHLCAHELHVMCCTTGELALSDELQVTVSNPSVPEVQSYQ